MIWQPDRTLWTPGDPLDTRRCRDRRRLPAWRNYGYGHGQCCEGVRCDHCTGSMSDEYAVTFSGVANGTCGTPTICTSYWNNIFTLVRSEDDPVNPCSWLWPGPTVTDYDMQPTHDCDDGCGARSYQVRLFWYTFGGSYFLWVAANIASAHCGTQTVEFYKEWEAAQPCTLDAEELIYDWDTVTTCDFSAATCLVSTV